MITIDFEFDGVYKDALILPDDHGLSDAEIQAIKQQRYDNWKIVINTPPTLDEDQPPQEDQPLQEEQL